LAKAMVAKWFNRDKNGCFNMQLIGERGKYDATEMDLAVAQSSKRGVALLADAGEELIKNTFLIVNDFDYVNKEDLATGINAAIDIVDALNDDSMDDDTKELVKAGCNSFRQRLCCPHNILSLSFGLERFHCCSVLQ
jgi:hypothetical protein